MTLESLQSENAALRTIAAELAEKCKRGKCYCVACAAVSYDRELIHNPECPVTKLETLLNGSKPT